MNEWSPNDALWQPKSDLDPPFELAQVLVVPSREKNTIKNWFEGEEETYPFIVGVHCTRSLVQEQHFALPKKSTRDGDTLFFSSRQLATLRAHFSVVSLHHTLNNIQPDSNCSLTCGNDMMNWSILALAAAFIMSSNEMFSIPYAMFSPMVKSNKIGSWLTRPRRERTQVMLSCRMSTPSKS